MSYFAPLSFWEKDTFLTPVDIAVIGGGIVGMNAALKLKESHPRFNIAILERASIGAAASSRNAGFACYGSPSEILTDTQNMSETDVYNLVRRRVDGLTLIRSIVGEKELQYSRTGGHEVFLDKESLDLHLENLNRINQLICPIDPQLKFYPAEDSKGIARVAGIISNDWEGQLHPGRMTDALRNLCVLKGIRVLTNANVEHIEEGNGFRIRCGSFDLDAQKIIVCNNGFAKNLLEIETTPARNQVLVTSPIPNLKISGSYHYDRGYVYFRKVGDRVLIGGGRNIDRHHETTDRFGQTELIRNYLISILEKHILPNQPYEISDEWSGILGFNKTKQPIIREVQKDMYVAVGLGGMGVAIGTLVGQEVANLLLQS